MDPFKGGPPAHPRGPGATLLRGPSGVRLHPNQYLSAAERTWVWKGFYKDSRRGFRKLGVPYFGVLIIRILLFRVLH